MLPKPAVAAKTDDIQRQVCPKLVLWLVHPIVPERAEPRHRDPQENCEDKGTRPIEQGQRGGPSAKGCPEQDAALPGRASAGAADGPEVLRHAAAHHGVKGLVAQQLRRRRGARCGEGGALLRRPHKTITNDLLLGDLVLSDDRSHLLVVVVVSLKREGAVLETIAGKEEDVGAARVLGKEGLEVVPLPADAPVLPRRRVERDAR
mmetsp:Transcript_121720/g.351425  ORF Transcript_121720/g.351425 Transcript_121720/m.351425 type:complete len:205 (+) Transcript_121720:736-1350(+)